jgi:DNA-binding transcriptional regulator GbsR (MarR family)
MEQFSSITEQTRLEEIAETLIAILKELRDSNRRERERDARREAESAAAKVRYSGL